MAIEAIYIALQIARSGQSDTFMVAVATPPSTNRVFVTGDLKR